ncbi:MAG: hypothetical protein IKC34_02260 [Clostridia bacterium]|nr:hypothetical protein [Clostridia bacterium]
MKKVLCILLIFISSLLSLFSCAEPSENILSYDGPQIKSFEYIHVDYNGCLTECKLLDLESGTVFFKRYFPSDEKIADYEVLYTIDLSKKELLINLLYTAGLFNLDELYTTEDLIYDGGGFEFIISYADGSEKLSRGSNAEPTEIFKKADEYFFDVTGEEFIGRVEDSYKYPPKTYIQTNHHEDFPHSGPQKYLLLSPYRYTWRKHNFNADSFTVPTIEPTKNGDDQLIMLQYSDDIIKDVKIFTYESSETEKNSLRRKKNTGYSKSHYVIFDLKPNTNYIVILEFENGTAEYRFKTE